MKRIFMALAFAIIATGAFAQTDSVRTRNANSNTSSNGMHKTNKQNTNHTNHTNQKQHSNNSNEYMMMNGKMMYSKNGKMTTMTQDKTFANGAVLKTDGTLIMKDGTRQTVTDGQYVNSSGKVVKSGSNKNMSAAPDSSGGKKY
jgi:hypothetical protein